MYKKFLILFMFLIPSVYANFNTSLVAYYPFDDNLQDAHTGGNHLTGVNSPPTDNIRLCKNNNCLNLDDTSECAYSSDTDFQIGTGDFTISWWSMWGSFTNSDHMIRNYQTYLDYQNPNIRYWGGVTTPWDNKTQIDHYVLRRNNSQIGLWINNRNYGNATRANDINDVYFVVGGSDNLCNNDLNGTIDELGFWSRALDESEIAELYSGVFYPTWVLPQADNITIKVYTKNNTVYNNTNINIKFNTNSTLANYIRCTHKITDINMSYNMTHNHTNGTLINFNIYNKTTYNTDVNWSMNCTGLGGLVNENTTLYTFYSNVTNATTPTTNTTTTNATNVYVTIPDYSNYFGLFFVLTIWLILLIFSWVIKNELFLIITSLFGIFLTFMLYGGYSDISNMLKGLFGFFNISILILIWMYK